MYDLLENYWYTFSDCIEEYLSTPNKRKNHVANQIKSLLDLQWEIDISNSAEASEIRNRSNCNQTTQYVLWLRPDIGVLEEGGEDKGDTHAAKWNEWFNYSEVKDIYNDGYTDSLNSCIKTWYPILCIICDWTYVKHSFVILWKDSDWHFGFEQSSRWGRWAFNYTKKVRYYGKRYYKSID